MMWRALSSSYAILCLVLLVLGASPSASFAAYETGYCTPPLTACGCQACGCPAPAEPAQPSCPPGQVIYGDYCLPACSEGWIRYPGYPGVCLPPCHQGCPEGYDQIPLPYCPEGYHRDLANPNDCLPDFDQPGYTGNCPSGTVISPYTQECTVDCPPGSYVGADGLCRSYYQDSCQPGLQHDPETGRCVPAGTWPRGYEWICLPQCPQGYVRDIAQPTRCLPPPADCPEGYERTTNNRCEPACAPGRERDPYGYCVPQSCPDDSYPNLSGECQQLECPTGYESYSGSCLPPCETGYSRNQTGTCVPPERNCPEGTQTFSGQCMPDCREGYVQDPDTGLCSRETQGCLTGTELVGGECVPLCKAGTLRNQAGLCVSTGCPKGQEKVNGTCLPRCEPPLERDAKYRCVCPQGTEGVNGKCRPLCREGMSRSASGQCTCLTGFAFVGGQCVPDCKTGLVRDSKGICVEPACKEGEESFRGRCVSACPEGLVRDRKGKCVCPRGTVLGPSGYCQPAETACPEGYRRTQDGECVRKSNVTRSCPEGYHYDKRYKTCRPDKATMETDSGADQVQTPSVPDSLKLMVPDAEKTTSTGAASGDPADCPEGYVRTKKGKCVKKQP